LLGHVGKRTIAVVAVETILSKICAKDIIEAVVVIVAYTHTVGPTHRSESSLLRHIGEGSVAIVLIKAVRRFGRVALQSRAGKQKDIHPAIIVVVDERATAAVCFHDVFLGLDASINHRRV